MFIIASIFSFKHIYNCVKKKNEKNKFAAAEIYDRKFNF